MADSGGWTPAFEGQRPPFPVVHSAHSPIRLAPRAAEIADGLRSIVPSYREADEPMIRLCAGVLARVEAASVWLAEQELGIFRDRAGEIQPVLRALSTWENTAGRLLNALGCSPTSRAQLGLDIARARQAVTLTGLAAEAELGADVDGEEVEG